MNQNGRSPCWNICGFDSGLDLEAGRTILEANLGPAERQKLQFKNNPLKINVRTFDTVNKFINYNKNDRVGA